MKSLSFLILLLIFTCCSNSQPLSGYWCGTMEMNAKTVDISLIIDNGKGLLTSSNLMLFEEEPVAGLKFKSNTISFSIDIETIFQI